MKLDVIKLLFTTSVRLGSGRAVLPMETSSSILRGRHYPSQSILSCSQQAGHSACRPFQRSKAAVLLQDQHELLQPSHAHSSEKQVERRGQIKGHRPHMHIFHSELF